MKMTSRSALVVSTVLLTAACGAETTQTTHQASPQTVGPASATTTATATATIEHTVTSLTGESVELASFRGRPMLIVNTASKCGYTPQYAGLQKLHETYGERGLAVIGFPSNDFGNQEPGSAEEIGKFCRLNYGVTFPMMAKVHTKGPEQAPIYRTLTSETRDGIQGEIRWNFTKFLVDADGNVVARFEPGVEPLDEKITSAIEALLGSETAAG